jgi:tryptophan-rich sensory protein
MADVSPKSSKESLFVGLLLFVAFEAVAFYGLQYLTSGLGESNQMQPENTIVSNWLKAMVFFVLHLVLVIAAMLVLSNQLPRHHRGQVMGWFYLGLLMSFALLIPLFG